MNKNEIVARWMGLPLTKEEPRYLDDRYEPIFESIEYPMDHNLLHEAWVKFRDLKFDGAVSEYVLDIHKTLKRKIGWAILNSEITEAFDELVKGIEWYESLNKKA